MGGAGALPRAEEPLRSAFPEPSAGRRALRGCLRASPSTLLALPLAPAPRLKCRRSAQVSLRSLCSRRCHHGSVEDVRNPEQYLDLLREHWKPPRPRPRSVTLPQSAQVLRLDPAQTQEALSCRWQSSRRQRQ